MTPLPRLLTMPPPSQTFTPLPYTISHHSNKDHGMHFQGEPHCRGVSQSPTPSTKSFLLSPKSSTPFPLPNMASSLMSNPPATPTLSCPCCIAMSIANPQATNTALLFTSHLPFTSPFHSYSFIHSKLIMSQPQDLPVSDNDNTSYNSTKLFPPFP